MPIHVVQPPKPCQFSNTVFQSEKKKEDENDFLEVLFLWCFSLPGLDIFDPELYEAVDGCTTFFLIEVV